MGKSAPMMRLLQERITERVHTAGPQPAQAILRATAAFVPQAFADARIDKDDPSIDPSRHSFTRERMQDFIAGIKRVAYARFVGDKVGTCWQTPFCGRVI